MLQLTFNQRRLSLMLAVILGLGLLLVWQPVTTRAEDTPTEPTTNLSLKSGPTGSLITVSGTLPADSFTYSKQTSIYANQDEKSPFFVYLGTTAVSDNGGFSWTGTIPRGGRGGAADGTTERPTINFKPGPLRISFTYGDGIPAFSQPGIFNITDSSKGPFSDGGGDVGSFDSTWSRTDALVQQGKVSRSWLWGPTSNTFYEPYQEGSDGWRLVSYYDKTRMEVTNPSAPKDNNPYYVTNGLLVREMVNGSLQLGNNNFQKKEPANVPVAGDFSPVNPSTSFAVWATLQNQNGNQEGAVINQTLTKEGKVGQNASLGSYGVKATNLVKETNHYIASPFWDYLNSTGPVQVDYTTVKEGRIFDPLFAATGYPIAEAYWTRTLVGGAEKDVLVQLFERRVLTYTPSNPAAYRVEMGNVGLQYFKWRYGN